MSKQKQIQVSVLKKERKKRKGLQKLQRKKLKEKKSCMASVGKRMMY